MSLTTCTVVYARCSGGVRASWGKVMKEVSKCVTSAGRGGILELKRWCILLKVCLYLQHLKGTKGFAFSGYKYCDVCEQSLSSSSFKRQSGEFVRSVCNPCREKVDAEAVSHGLQGCLFPKFPWCLSSYVKLYNEAVVHQYQNVCIIANKWILKQEKGTGRQNVILCHCIGPLNHCTIG